ncbi:MAG: NAD(P)H-dependent oxidoreductase subunit E [Faecousia sp.]
MDWNLRETLAYYKEQGAPKDQSIVISLLTEVQREYGGSIPQSVLAEMADCYGVKDTFFLAIIRRIPRLRLSDTHTLELCAGPNCAKAAALARAAEALCAGKNVSLKYVPCMRMCAKGPNLKWDGKQFHQASEQLLQTLLKNL